MKRKYLLSTVLFLCVPFGAAQAATNADLATKVSKQTGVSEEEAGQFVSAVFDAIRTQLVAGEELTVRNFGRFYVQQRDARKGRNPRTGEELQIPARNYPKFAASEKLKEVLNSK